MELRPAARQQLAIAQLQQQQLDQMIN